MYLSPPQIAAATANHSRRKPQPPQHAEDQPLLHFPHGSAGPGPGGPAAPLALVKGSSVPRGAHGLGLTHIMGKGKRQEGKPQNMIGTSNQIITMLETNQPALVV